MVRRGNTRWEYEKRPNTPDTVTKAIIMTMAGRAAECRLQGLKGRYFVSRDLALWAHRLTQKKRRVSQIKARQSASRVADDIGAAGDILAVARYMQESVEKWYLARLPGYWKVTTKAVSEPHLWERM